MDLSQYPVFPWILFDYESPSLNLNAPKSFRDLSKVSFIFAFFCFHFFLILFFSVCLSLLSNFIFLASPISRNTKPVGALNPTRLNQFKMRYEEIPSDQPRFLYGTHYSTPGYVLYYMVRLVSFCYCLLWFFFFLPTGSFSWATSLTPFFRLQVRQFPEFMLYLQNGKFDEPDRLFYSMQTAWNSAYSSPGDVKELIPEFFLPPANFLLNKQVFYFLFFHVGKAFFYVIHFFLLLSFSFRFPLFFDPPSIPILFLYRILTLEFDRMDFLLQMWIFPLGPKMRTSS